MPRFHEIQPDLHDSDKQANMSANTRSKRRPDSRQVDSQKPGKSKIDWHGIKVGSRKSTYDAKLQKLLIQDKKARSSELPLLWLLNPIKPEAHFKQVKQWSRKVARTETASSSVRSRLADAVIQAIDAMELQSLSSSDGLRILAACHTIRTIAGHCEFEDWSELISRIFQASKVASSSEQMEPVTFQWLAVEVPLTIAFQIPEMEDYRQLASIACQHMATAVSEMLDSDGWPNARYLNKFGPIAASWIRSILIARKLEIETADEFASQLEWMVPQLLKLQRPDRSLMFSHPNSAPLTSAFIDALFQLSYDKTDQNLKQFQKSPRPPANTIGRKSLPEPSAVSEWSESAVLQSDWGGKAVRMGIDFSNQTMIAEISRKTNLTSGLAMPSIKVNGVDRQPNDLIGVVCEEHDEDVEYLELEVELDDQTTFTRQILLSRKEDFLLVADVVVPQQNSLIQYECRWPLAQGIIGMHESETREVYLRNRKIQSLVLPLALPEWKVERSHDSLTFNENDMVLKQQIEGAGLYAPLFFDLNPKRSRKKRTWRQLTIGENLNAVPRDVACAYRVQLNNQQWLFYRTISRPGNRTFMGENFSGEFVFNRFQQNGTVTKLIGIQ